MSRYLNIDDPAIKALLGDTYRRAVKAGFVVPPRIKPLLKPHSEITLDRETLYNLSREPIPLEQRRINQLNDPASNTHAQRYQESQLGNKNCFWMQTEEFHFADGDVLELARFSTFEGEFGVVKGINTWVECTNVISEPGATGTMIDLLSFRRNGVQIEFALKISNSWPAIPPQPYQGIAPYMPGQWFSDFTLGPRGPRWKDNRFVFGMPGSNGNQVFWLVPPGRHFRLFAYLGAGADNLHSLAGRLQGFTQPINTKAGQWSSEHGWQW